MVVDREKLSAKEERFRAVLRKTRFKALMARLFDFMTYFVLTTNNHAFVVTRIGYFTEIKLLNIE